MLNFSISTNIHSIPLQSSPQSHYSDTSEFPSLTSWQTFKFLTSFIFSSAHKRSEAFVSTDQRRGIASRMCIILSYRAKEKMSHGFNSRFHSLPIKAFDLKHFFGLHSHRTHEFAKNKIISVPSNWPRREWVNSRRHADENIFRKYPRRLRQHRKLK